MHNPNDSIKNKISLSTAIIIGINAMIGAGIISVPIVLSNLTGPAGILTFIFSMIVVILIGISLGRVAKIYPGDGWNYLYPASWAGHQVGLISAFCYIIGVIIALGFLIQQAALYTQHFFPQINTNFLGIIILASLTILILAGTETSSIVQYLIIACVIVPLLFTSSICWLNMNSNLIFPFMPKGPLSIISAAPAVIFGFLGFESIASLYPMVKNPNTNIPKACTIAVLIVGTFYLFFSTGVLFCIPSSSLIYGINQTLSSAISQTLPSWSMLPTLLALGALFAIIGTLHSMTWSVCILLMSVLKRIKSKYVSRAIAIKVINYKVLVLLISSCIFLLSLILSGDLLLYMTIFFMVPSFILSIASLLFIKEEWESNNNILTIFALIGGLLLIYFAGKPIFQILIS